MRIDQFRQSQRGAPGAAGAAGATWRSGSAAPDDALGNNGDFYLRTTNSDVYLKAGGTWSVSTNIKGAAGTNGSNGSNGSNGTNGATWRSGSGAPSNGTGADGDFYLRTDTSDVYLRASGTYSIALNIKGATGPTGPNKLLRIFSPVGISWTASITSQQYYQGDGSGAFTTNFCCHHIGESGETLTRLKVLIGTSNTLATGSVVKVGWWDKTAADFVSYLSIVPAMATESIQELSPAPNVALTAGREYALAIVGTAGSSGAVRVRGVESLISR